MQKFKLFTSPVENAESFEKEINDWLRENGIRIHHVTGNIGAPKDNGGELALFIFYETERGLF